MATIDTNMSLVMIDPNEPLELYDGTIIKGRLEWFLYALCCLDYGNLPTPLSRIEEWANALITNELPNMEPQSRAEEFFKAILTGDTSNLPTPQSRSEVLLDKLARGENDFTNVEKIQSRYEFLLAYLIKNGGGIGNIDYVLYKFQKEDETLYNTKERPVKSAILKGQTLVNVDSYYRASDFWYSNVANLSDDGYITMNATGGWVNSFTKVSSLIKPNTKYLVIYEIKQNSLNGIFTLLSQHDKSSVFTLHSYPNINPGQTGIFKYIVTTDATFDSDKTKVCLRNFLNAESTTGSLVYRSMVIEYQEGMENWDIPFFRGMQSVKMPVLRTVGKNLFDSTMSYGFISDSNGTINTNAKDWLCSDYVKLNKGTYTISSTEPFNGTKKIAIYDNNTTFVKTTTSTTFVLDNDGYVRVGVKLTGSGNILEEQISLVKLQIEVGTQATSFEQHKTNILTVNEEVELRGIGDVQDTLDCLTGEKVERIGEIVLDGSENWRSDGSNESYSRFVYNVSDVSNKWYKVLSNKFIGAVTNSLDGEKVYRNGYGKVNGIVISNDKLENLTVDGLKSYLMLNPIPVQYELEESTVKTVDLTITDQGGATIPKLKTFDKITHVNVSATDILPGEVEMEVATTIGEDLSGTLYSTMEDIETKQEALKESNNAQTESINSTMMATTEIYESLL